MIYRPAAEQLFIHPSESEGTRRGRRHIGSHIRLAVWILGTPLPHLTDPPCLDNQFSTEAEAQESTLMPLAIVVIVASPRPHPLLAHLRAHLYHPVVPEWHLHTTRSYPQQSTLLAVESICLPSLHSFQPPSLPQKIPTTRQATTRCIFVDSRPSTMTRSMRSTMG